MVDEVILEQESVAENVENVEQSQEQFAAPEQVKRDSEADRNFREIRKSNEELRRRISQYEAAAQKSIPPIVDDSDDIPIDDDAIAEGKHIKTVLRQQKQLKAELAELKAFKQKTAEDMVESRIRSRFSDYDQIVNSETLTVLAEEDPELAYTIQSSPDLYNKAVLAYKEIKKRGIMPSETYDKDKRRAADNASKPKPVASVTPRVGESPISQASAWEERSLSKADKLRHYEEMRKCMSGS